MNPKVLQDRTKGFAVDVAKFCDQLPTKYSFKAYSNQLVRASSSVGANYRAACRAKSTADFIYKLKIVEEECDECMYFLELISELEENQAPKILPLHNEANEILSIIVSSIKTMKAKQKKSKF